MRFDNTLIIKSSSLFGLWLLWLLLVVILPEAFTHPYHLYIRCLNTDRWCSMFNADLALSVTMTAISTILSVVMLPLNLLIYAKYSYDDDVIGNLDWTSLFVALAIVIGAISLGLWFSATRNSVKFNIFANKLGNFAGVTLVLFSATMTNTGGEDSKIWERDWDFYVATSLPCILGLVIANLMTSGLKLRKPERV